MTRSSPQDAGPQDAGPQDTGAAARRIADARRREMAVEHLLFGTIRFLAQRHPELLDELERSLSRLWDLSDDEPRSDEALREIAAKFIRSLRAER